MLIGIIGLAIGLMITGAGIYYLYKERREQESRKIYSSAIAVGVVVTVVAALIIFAHT